MVKEEGFQSLLVSKAKNVLENRKEIIVLPQKSKVQR